MFRQRTDCIDPGFHETVSPTVCSEMMLHAVEPMDLTSFAASEWIEGDLAGARAGRLAAVAAAPATAAASG